MVKQAVKQMLDARDRLDEAIHKAKSLSIIVYGESGESFRNLDDDHQDVILWILSDFIYAAAAAKDSLYAAIDGESE